MKSSPILFFPIFLLLLSVSAEAAAQCDSPDGIQGAEKYNALVCKAEAASQARDEKKALSIYLLAEDESPVANYPNVFLYDRVALSNARLGDFDLADLNLEYATIALQWMHGMVRCEKIPSSDDEILFREDHPLHSANARFMANVLCGDAYDKSHDENVARAGNGELAARMALRHSEIEKEVAALRRARPAAHAQE